MQPLPTAYDVVPQLVGLSVTPAEVTTLLGRSVASVRTYTRGAGFAPDGATLVPDLAAIVVASVVRALLNPEQALSLSGHAFQGTPGTFGEWTLTELLVLGSYRRSARSSD